MMSIDFILKLIINNVLSLPTTLSPSCLPIQKDWKNELSQHCSKVSLKLKLFIKIKLCVTVIFFAGHKMVHRSQINLLAWWKHPISSTVVNDVSSSCAQGQRPIVAEEKQEVMTVLQAAGWVSGCEITGVDPPTAVGDSFCDITRWICMYSWCTVVKVPFLIHPTALQLSLPQSPVFLLIHHWWVLLLSLFVNNLV